VGEEPTPRKFWGPRKFKASRYSGLSKDGQT